MTNSLSKWRIGIYLVAIFCAGGISGWALAARTTKEKIFSPPRQDEISSSLKTRLRAKMSLTPEQGRQIDGIIDRSSKEMQSIHGDCIKKIRQGLTTRNAQITALLTADQQKQFEQIEKERQEAWHSRGHGRRDRTGTNSAPSDNRSR
jgi:hypothetical protein